MSHNGRQAESVKGKGRKKRETASSLWRFVTIAHITRCPAEQTKENKLHKRDKINLAPSPTSSISSTPSPRKDSTSSNRYSGSWEDPLPVRFLRQPVSASVWRYMRCSLPPDVHIVQYCRHHRIESLSSIHLSVCLSSCLFVFLPFCTFKPSQLEFRSTGIRDDIRLTQLISPACLIHFSFLQYWILGAMTTPSVPLPSPESADI